MKSLDHYQYNDGDAFHVVILKDSFPYKIHLFNLLRELNCSILKTIVFVNYELKFYMIFVIIKLFWNFENHTLKNSTCSPLLPE